MLDGGMRLGHPGTCKPLEANKADNLDFDLEDDLGCGKGGDRCHSQQRGSHATTQHIHTK